MVSCFRSDLGFLWRKRSSGCGSEYDGPSNDHNDNSTDGYYCTSYDDHNDHDSGQADVGVDSCRACFAD